MMIILTQGIGILVGKNLMIERRKKNDQREVASCQHIIVDKIIFVGRKDKYNELEMEDEEFVDPQKAKYSDKSKEKDEDLESEQSLSDTSDADEVGCKYHVCIIKQVNLHRWVILRNSYLSVIQFTLIMHSFILPRHQNH